MTPIREEDEEGHRRQVMVPVSVRYDRILKLFTNNSGDAVRKYQRELLGGTTLFFSPDVYSLLSLSKEVLGDPHKLLMMISDPQEIRKAAKIIAQSQLSHMVEIVMRHDNLQAQKMERVKQKQAAKSKGKKK